MNDPVKLHFGNHESNIRFFETVCPSSDLQILEIGCGTGGFLDYLRTEGYNTAYGIEVDQERIGDGRPYYETLKLCLMQGEMLGFRSQSFDVVLSFDVFEHIPDTDRHLSEVRRVLKPGGAYLFQTPNMLTNIPFEILKEKSLTKWREYHCSLHSYWGLSKALSRHAFDFDFYKIPVVTPFFRKKLRRYWGRLGPILLAVINPDKFPFPLRTNFYVAARRR